MVMILGANANTYMLWTEGVGKMLHVLHDSLVSMVMARLYHGKNTTKSKSNFCHKA